MVSSWTYSFLLILFNFLYLFDGFFLVDRTLRIRETLTMLCFILNFEVHIVKSNDVNIELYWERRWEFTFTYTEWCTHINWTGVLKAKGNRRFQTMIAFLLKYKEQQRGCNFFQNTLNTIEIIFPFPFHLTNIRIHRISAV